MTKKKNRKSNTKLVTKTASKNPIKKTVKLPKFGTGARKYTTQRGADIAFGLSAKGAFTNEMMLSMNDKPIVFAMANPDPEINPDELR